MWFIVQLFIVEIAIFTFGIKLAGKDDSMKRLTLLLVCAYLNSCKIIAMYVHNYIIFEPEINFNIVLNQKKHFTTGATKS